MIFGSEILVDDGNGGLSSPGNSGNDQSHPDYEYRLVSLSMSSRDAMPVTRCDVSRHIFDISPLKRGDYEHHKSKFEKDISVNRCIKSNIDMESISDGIYCISKKNGAMIAVSPSQIRVLIREIKDEDSPDIYCGEFYFNDKNEDREYPFKQGDDSLSISLNLDAVSFSRIFDSLKNGDNLIEFSIYFPAYADWLDSMAGTWPTTYVIKTESKDENFVMLSSISSTRATENPAEREDNLAPDDYSDTDAETEEKIELKDLELSIRSTNELLATHINSGKKITTYLAVISTCLILLAIKVLV